MDHPVRVPPAPRTQWLFGLYESFRRATRPRADERVDLPAIQESTRVSFGEGIAPQPGFPVRAGVDRYRVLQRDEMHLATTKSGETPRKEE